MNARGAEHVTFGRPFCLPGMSTAHAPGTFDLLAERHELDVVWPAYRETLTILLPSGAAIEAWPVTRGDLDAALAADRGPAA